MWTDPGASAPQYYLDQLVMVDLDIVFGPPPAGSISLPDGRLTESLVLTGKVPGAAAQVGSRR